MLVYLDTLIGFVVVLLGISLLITTATQMISAVLSSRGANLHWGLKVLFSNIDANLYPQLANRAEEIARSVLTHCLVSDSVFSNKSTNNRLIRRFQLANAIRPQELAAILEHLAAHPPSSWSGSNLPAEIRGLLQAVNPTTAREIEITARAAAAAASAVPPVRRAIDQAGGAVGQAAGNLEAWFNTMMDRVSQRFTLHMRLITVFASVLFAFVSGLSAPRVLDDIYRNGTFRAALVGAAPQMSKVAEDILQGAKTPQAAAQRVVTDIYTAAAASAVTDAGATADAKPADLPTRDAAVKWITDHVADPAQRDAALKLLDTKIAEISRQQATKVGEQAGRVNRLLEQTGFDVLRLRWPDKWEDRLLEIPGVLATAALLSLGAPFWFNALKGLANLRPIVAGRQQAEAERRTGAT
jgi:hypothetical protein